MIQNTYQKAKDIMQYIQEYLVNIQQSDFLSIRSIYIVGSYVRGDWLNMSIDLDLSILVHENSNKNIVNTDRNKLKNIINNKFGELPFESQASEIGSIEFGINSLLP